MLGVSRVYADGGIDAQALRFEGNIGSRTVGVSNVIKRHARPDCIGVCIEEPFSGQFSNVKALFPMLGAAVLACELAGLPWSTVHLSKLKIAATGKGNAKSLRCRLRRRRGGARTWARMKLMGKREGEYFWEGGWTVKSD
jgi:Holliday junction resolvasome RuvABC endonuclease subunit